MYIVFFDRKVSNGARRSFLEHKRPWRRIFRAHFFSAGYCNSQGSRSVLCAHHLNNHISDAGLLEEAFFRLKRSSLLLFHHHPYQPPCRRQQPPRPSRRHRRRRSVTLRFFLLRLRRDNEATAAAAASPCPCRPRNDWNAYVTCTIVFAVTCVKRGEWRCRDAFAGPLPGRLVGH